MVDTRSMEFYNVCTNHLRSMRRKKKALQIIHCDMDQGSKVFPTEPISFSELLVKISALIMCIICETY